MGQYRDVWVNKDVVVRVKVHLVAFPHGYHAGKEEDTSTTEICMSWGGLMSSALFTLYTEPFQFIQVCFLGFVKT